RRRARRRGFGRAGAPNPSSPKEGAGGERERGERSLPLDAGRVEGRGMLAIVIATMLVGSIVGQQLDGNLQNAVYCFVVTPTRRLPPMLPGVFRTLWSLRPVRLMGPVVVILAMLLLGHPAATAEGKPKKGLGNKPAFNEMDAKTIAAFEKLG